jgi:prevent-host-death family protein
MSHRTTQVMDLDGPEQSLAEVVSQVTQRETRIIVEERGVPVAAIISAEELQRLSELDREREDHFSVIDRVRTAFAGVPDDEIEAETDQILARVRASARTTNHNE